MNDVLIFIFSLECTFTNILDFVPAYRRFDVINRFQL